MNSTQKRHFIEVNGYLIEYFGRVGEFKTKFTDLTEFVEAHEVKELSEIEQRVKQRMNVHNCEYATIRECSPPIFVNNDKTRQKS